MGQEVITIDEEPGRDRERRCGRGEDGHGKEGWMDGWRREKAQIWTHKPDFHKPDLVTR